MKNLLLVLTILTSFTLAAQKEIKEGILISKQTMSSENPQVNAQLEMMGKTDSKTYFKDGKSRGEVKNPMSGDVTTITDSNSLQILLLMDNPMLGKKFALQKIKDEDIKKVDIKKGDKSKTILGYTCHQYFVTLKQNGGEINIEMYVTDKIAGSSQYATMTGNKIKGIPLFMIMKMNQMGTVLTITSEVTDIKKETVSDDKFNMTPPEGYTEMKM